MKREREKRQEFIKKKTQKDTAYEQQQAGSQARASRGLLQALVPAVAWWLEHHYEEQLKKSRLVNQAAKEYNRMKSWLTPAMMAHITCTVVLDNLGRGTTYKTKINTLRMYIGRHLEDQAMMEYMANADPYYFNKLQKKYLHDPSSSL